MQLASNPDSLPAANSVPPSMSPSSKSQSPAGNAAVATLLGWFLPGAGQLYLGQMVLGVIAFVVVQGCFGLGYLLSDGRVLDEVSDTTRLSELFGSSIDPEQLGVTMQD